MRPGDHRRRQPRRRALLRHVRRGASRSRRPPSRAARVDVALYDTIDAEITAMVDAIKATPGGADATSRSSCGWRARTAPSSRRSARRTSRSRSSASKACSPSRRSSTCWPCSRSSRTSRPTRRCCACSPAHGGGSARATSPCSGDARPTSPAGRTAATTTPTLESELRRAGRGHRPDRDRLARRRGRRPGRPALLRRGAGPVPGDLPPRLRRCGPTSASRCSTSPAGRARPRPRPRAGGGRRRRRRRQHRPAARGHRRLLPHRPVRLAVRPGRLPRRRALLRRRHGGLHAVGGRLGQAAHHPPGQGPGVAHGLRPAGLGHDLPVRARTVTMDLQRPDPPGPAARRRRQPAGPGGVDGRGEARPTSRPTARTP